MLGTIMASGDDNGYDLNANDDVSDPSFVAAVIC